MAAPAGQGAHLRRVWEKARGGEVRGAEEFKVALSFALAKK